MASDTDFEHFYDGHVDMLIGYFQHRVGDPEVAADLTAETFAAALVARRRLRRAQPAPAAWLFGLAERELAEQRSRGAARDRMRRRLGLEPLEPGAGDAATIARLGEEAAWRLVDALPADRREAVRARELAEAKEAVVRVRAGPEPDAPARPGKHAPAGDFVAALREQLLQALLLPRLPVPRLSAVALAGAAALLVVLVAIAATGGLKPEPRVAERPPRPEPEARPLFGGSLQPGVRYRTTDFVPALSFAVGDDDWFVAESNGVDFLYVERRNRSGEPGGERPPLGRLAFVRLTQVYDPAVRGLRASLVTGPADVHRWLGRHPDVRVGPRRPATVAGVPATVFDAEVAFTRPAHRDPGCWARLRLLCTALGPNSALPDGTRERVYLLPIGYEPLLVGLIALPGGELADLEPPAARVLETLRVGIR